MKFPYIAYGGTFGTPQPGVVYRPVVSVFFRATRGAIRRHGLVDTGSDITLAPAWIADVIGASLPQSPTELVAGIDGAPIEARVALVEMEIRRSRQSLRFQSRVHFAVQDFVLLGTEGFLEFFTAEFDWAAKTLELLPNDRFVSAK